MKRNFMIRLEQLTSRAQAAIRLLIQEKKEMVIFGAFADGSGEDWTKDIYDDVPDFPFYGRQGFIGYAAVQAVKLEGDTVIVTGILKNDYYPDSVKVILAEMDSYSSVALADYLQEMVSEK